MAAQCDNGDVSAIGTTCTTSDGGAGMCFAEMCSVVDEAGTSLGPCALCYAEGDQPPGDGGAIVVISTTTTTTDTDPGACAVGRGGRGGFDAADAADALVLVVLVCASVRQARQRRRT